MEQSERKRIIELVKSEVIPAVGCTEPIAVALCVAKATEALGCLPEKIDLKLSPNILKNAMGVGIPGTGMIGLPIAVALGAICGKSEYQLEVLKDVCPDYVAKGKSYVSENRISIRLKSGITEKLYIEVTVSAGDNTSRAVVSGGHTHFVLVERNGETLYADDTCGSQTEASADADRWLTLSRSMSLPPRHLLRKSSLSTRRAVSTKPLPTKLFVAVTVTN